MNDIANDRVGPMPNPPHLDEPIRESMDEVGRNVTETAARLGCERGTLSRLLNGRAGVSANVALVLEDIGWGTANCWMRMQASYELAQARRDRAAGAFAEDWKDAAYEKGDAQSFYNAFINVFGVRRLNVARYKAHVANLDNFYNPDLMPPDLRRAHQALNRAVDRLYRRSGFAFERERVEHLFMLYEKMYTPLGVEMKKDTARRKRGKSNARTIRS